MLKVLSASLDLGSDWLDCTVPLALCLRLMHVIAPNVSDVLKHQAGSQSMKRTLTCHVSLQEQHMCPDMLSSPSPNSPLSPLRYEAVSPRHHTRSLQHLRMRKQKPTEPCFG